MVMVIMRMVVAMMVIMRVFVIMMVPVPMVVIMLMPMMVSMIVVVAVAVAVAVAQIVLQIVFVVGLRRGLGRAGASAAGFRLGRFLIGRVGLGGLRALHLLSGQGSGFRFTLVMPAAMCMIVVMMMTMVVLMRMLMMMPMSMAVSMVVAVLVPVVVLVLVLVLVLMLMLMLMLMPMLMPMPMLVVVLMRMLMMMPMFMAVVMIMSVVMSASAAMLAQALVVELVRHLQPLLIQQRQRASTVAGCCAGRLDLLCRHAFSQQGQPLVEITMANAVDHQTRAGRRQRQRQSQLNQQVGRIAHQLLGLLGQNHQLGRVRQVETHRHMAGRHMLKPVGVSRGRHGLQPDANATAAPRGALRRLTACRSIRGLQQQAAGGCQGQQGPENTC